MKIVVFGGNGQLGSDIVSKLTVHHEVFPVNHDQVDITNDIALKECIETINPDVIINTAAYHHVDLCEQNPDKAEAVNDTAPTLMAKLCDEKNIRFIHFSTDYVFDGNKNAPYIETDEALPLNVYGKTKRDGEINILKVNPKAIILRVSGLYGTNPCRAKNGLNFVQLMLKLANEKGEVKVVDDEYVSPTYTVNIAEQIEPLLIADISGIIHSTSEGFCSWYDFAEEIFKYTKTTVLLHKANSNDFPAKVARPKYSVLENMRLKKAGINFMLPWNVALHQYLDSIGYKK